MRVKLLEIVFVTIMTLVLIFGCGLVEKDVFIGSATPEDTPAEDIVEDVSVAASRGIEPLLRD